MSDGPPAPSLPSRFPFGLIATDLDGTLLRSDQTISRRTRAALAAAQAAGAEHIVVTGRSVAWTHHILDDLGYRGLAVCGQGAQLYHAGERRLLTALTLDRAVARAALALLEGELGPLAVAANRDGMDGQVVMDPAYHRAAFGAFPVQSDGRRPARPVDRDEVLAEPVIKLYLRHPELSDDELAARARAHLDGRVGIVVSGEGLVEMLPAGLTKASGLSLAARRLGLSASDTIAFGDMPNDIPMLTWAAHGVAMAGAHPQVRAAADEVAPAGNDDDGIAVVLERLLAPAAGTGADGAQCAPGNHR